MREIRFRIWDEENKVMIYPDSLIWFGNESCQYNGDMGYILQQYTGMQDKDGRDIYEGDVVELERGLSDYYYVVEWVFAGFQLVTYKKPESTVRGISDGINQGYFEDSDGVKVIGNIYENPELVQA